MVRRVEQYAMTSWTKFHGGCQDENMLSPCPIVPSDVELLRPGQALTTTTSTYTTMLLPPSPHQASTLRGHRRCGGICPDSGESDTGPVTVGLKLPSHQHFCGLGGAVKFVPNTGNPSLSDVDLGGLVKKMVLQVYMIWYGHFFPSKTVK